MLTHSLKAKRNPFCSVKKEVLKQKNSLTLLASGGINESSLAVAVIKNGESIGHYKQGDHLGNLIIIKIYSDSVECKDKAGNRITINP